MKPAPFITAASPLRLCPTSSLSQALHSTPLATHRLSITPFKSTRGLALEKGAVKAAQRHSRPLPLASFPLAHSPPQYTLCLIRPSPARTLISQR